MNETNKFKKKILALFIMFFTITGYTTQISASEIQNKLSTNINPINLNFRVTAMNLDWNQIIIDYKMFISITCGIGAVSLIWLFILQLAKLKGTISPCSRKPIWEGIFWTGLMSILYVVATIHVLFLQ